MLVQRTWFLLLALGLPLIACEDATQAGDDVRNSAPVRPSTAAGPATVANPLGTQDREAPVAGVAELPQVEGGRGTRVAASPLVSAVLHSEHDAEIRARIEGVVRAVHVELGDRVEAGQVMAELYDQQEAAVVASAAASVEHARASYHRAAELRKEDMVPESELEAALFRLRVAEAALEEATVKLGFTRLRAPFDGHVSRRLVRYGEPVSTGDALFRVTRLSPLRALVRVPELWAARLQPGGEVLLRGLDGSEVEGRIARIAPAVDPMGGTVEVLVDVTRPGGLRPGSAVTVEFR